MRHDFFQDLEWLINVLAYHHAPTMKAQAFGSLCNYLWVSKCGFHGDLITETWG